MNIPGWYNGMIADPSSIVQAEGHGDAGPNPAPGTESQPEWECIGHFDCLGARGTPAPLLTENEE